MKNKFPRIFHSNLKIWQLKLSWNEIMGLDSSWVKRSLEWNSKNSSIDLRINITSCSKPTLWLLLHLLPPCSDFNNHPHRHSCLNVAVHSELLHLVWVLVTLLPLQYCVSLLFITEGVIPIPVVINVFYNNRDRYEEGKVSLIIILNSTLNAVLDNYLIRDSKHSVHQSHLFYIYLNCVLVASRVAV